MAPCIAHVMFRKGHHALFRSSESLQMGDAVVVPWDRGEDLGVVFDVSPYCIDVSPALPKCRKATREDLLSGRQLVDAEERLRLTVEEFACTSIKVQGVQCQLDESAATISYSGTEYFDYGNMCKSLHEQYSKNIRFWFHRVPHEELIFPLGTNPAKDPSEHHLRAKERRDEMTKQQQRSSHKETAKEQSVRHRNRKKKR